MKKTQKQIDAEIDVFIASANASERQRENEYFHRKVNRLNVLLRDVGYRYEGGILRQRDLPGYPGQVVGKFSSILQACEHLAGAIGNRDGYVDRYVTICNG